MQYLTPDMISKYNMSDGVFLNLSMVLDAADGLSLRQVCSLSGLEPSTIQNWIKRGFVPHPINKMYSKRHLARILLISVLRDCMKIENIGFLLKMLNGDTDDTSDDIISEENLYDCLCRIIQESTDYIGKNEISIIVKKTTSAVLKSDKANTELLDYALEIMVTAYIAGQYKKAVDNKFALMKEVYYESKN